MALVSDGAFIADEWRRLADEESLPGSGKVIVSLGRVASALADSRHAAVGVYVANTVDPKALADFLPRLALVDIAFPAFTDGRGFSVARLLRRQGYAGELRASGRLAPDQYLHAIGCGFDAIEIPDDLAAHHGEANWGKALGARSLSYQRGVAAGRSILERRRKASHAKPSLVEILAPRLAPLDLDHRLKLTREVIPGRIVFTTSFGIEDQLVTHSIFTQGLEIDVVTIDTGRLFEETIALWERTEARYARRIHAAYPQALPLADYVAEHGVNGFYRSVENRKACCHIRKVEPLSRLLAGASAWVTGLRADQSQAREGVHLIESDAERRLVKLNPLADYTRESIVAATEEFSVPVNELHEKGFLSIGCAPCTRALEAGESERAGRWWWEEDEKKECGLHVGPDGRLTRGSAPEGSQ